MKESLIYQRLDHKKVQCGVCNHFCKINDGNRGVCGVRENHAGKLIALNYGKCIAVSLDPVEKKPLYHFLPRTLTYSFSAVGCNFRCDWCQNFDISQGHKATMSIPGDNILSEEHVAAAIENNCPSISYTYTEPTMFIEYALNTMKIAKKKGLKNIWVSNGFMSEESLKIILPYLDAINVDLKSFNDKTYQKYCGAKLKPILDNLKIIVKNKIHLEITTLVIPGLNDSKKELRDIAKFIAKLSQNIPWHISRFFPDWKMEGNITPLKTLEMAKQLGEKAGLRNVYIGNV